GPCMGCSETGSTSSSTSGSSTSSSSGSGGAPPDCPGLEPGSQCTVLPQCGCDAGSMCVPNDAAGGGACVPSGNASKVDKCAANAACAPGLGCAGYFGNGTSIHICGPISSDPCGAFSTSLTIDGTSTPVAGLNVCLIPCDEAHPQNPIAPYDPCG